MNLACREHNHAHCISDALASARQLCEGRGAKLTALRAQVLGLIWESHKPLGAYSLMDMLAKASTRRVAPPTVYRALDFLLEHGLIHRINALNAFIGCPSPQERHQSYFLICRGCGVAFELEDPALAAQVQATVDSTGFTIHSQSLEIMGSCPNCRVESQ